MSRAGAIFRRDRGQALSDGLTTGQWRAERLETIARKLPPGPGPPYLVSNRRNTRCDRSDGSMSQGRVTPRVGPVGHLSPTTTPPPPLPSRSSALQDAHSRRGRSWRARNEWQPPPALSRDLGKDVIRIRWRRPEVNVAARAGSTPAASARSAREAASHLHSRSPWLLRDRRHSTPLGPAPGRERSRRRPRGWPLPCLSGTSWQPFMPRTDPGCPGPLVPRLPARPQPLP